MCIYKRKRAHIHIYTTYALLTSSERIGYPTDSGALIRTAMLKSNLWMTFTAKILFQPNNIQRAVRARVDRLATNRQFATSNKQPSVVCAHVRESAPDKHDRVVLRSAFERNRIDDNTKTKFNCALRRRRSVWFLYTRTYVAHDDAVKATRQPF